MKSNNENKVTVSAFMKKEDADEIRTYVKEKGITLSEYIAESAKGYMSNHDMKDKLKSAVLVATNIASLGMDLAEKNGDDIVYKQMKEWVDELWSYLK